ncbi:hypothetical protein [Dyella terrae]|uniref:hypothetical protein n=1 Tax=Dyella terrae TaxID=522259 RepID=UPI001EFD6272|nr:hypothetical protein [Dyella terrae]ULU23191.1 hypothetical protein DYST_00082 [Dyella terrae]
MDEALLEESARYIVKRNISSNVEAATIQWDAAEGKLDLTYYTLLTPLDEDEEWCEIAMTELIAAFPDVRSADTHLVKLGSNDSGRSDDERLVFRKKR